jgi:hypothetical protein
MEPTGIVHVGYYVMMCNKCIINIHKERYSKMKNKCENCPAYVRLVDAAQAAGKELPDINHACVDSETGEPSDCRNVLRVLFGSHLLTFDDIVRQQDAYNRAFFVCVLGGIIPPDKKGD